MRNLYIAGTGPGSGKSLVVAGIMDLLNAAGLRVGFFRPIVAEGGEDKLTEWARSHWALGNAKEELRGCTADVANAMAADGKLEALIELILDRFRSLNDGFDIVVCVGTDFEGLLPSFELDFNIDLARNLGCSMLGVVPGFQGTADSLLDAARMAHASIRERGADVLGVFVNGVQANEVEEAKRMRAQRWSDKELLYFLPAVESLNHATVGEIRDAVGAVLIRGDSAGLERDVGSCVVAAMQVPDYLRRLEDRAFVVTPGDRCDVILASLATHLSTRGPRISGLLLTGGIEPDPTAMAVVDGLPGVRVPILSVEDNTLEAALAVSKVEAQLLPGPKRRLTAALGTFERHVDVDHLRQRIRIDEPTRVTPLMFEYDLLQRARAADKRIVLPEGADERILRAAEIVSLRKSAHLTLLGHEAEVRQRMGALGLALDDVEVVDPSTSPLRDRFAEVYAELRAHKGMTTDFAREVVVDPSYFGTLMVHLGEVDGMVSGAVHTTQHTIRPAFEIIKTRPGSKLVSSVFLMCLPDKVLVYGDCAVNPNPNAEVLADIAIASADTARQFGIEPRVALLSYSSGSSGKGADVEKVRQAARIARERKPSLRLDGPMQYDAAVDPKVGRSKLPDSEVAGRASVLVFPDLNAGNNTYKAVQRSSGAVAIGPVLQGLNRPVNDLSRGCTVADVVNTIAITAIQAVAKEDKP